MFHQFLLVFLKRCVLYNTLHHTIDGVFAEPLLLVPNIFGGGGGFQLWRDEKDLCLAALEDVYEFIAPVTPGKFLAEHDILSKCLC